MQAATQLVGEMGGVSEIVAPRIEGNLQRPEIVIRPRLDLAADLGVTTAALSQAIRIATLRSEEHTSELQSLMRISYAVFCLKKKKETETHTEHEESMRP